MESVERQIVAESSSARFAVLSEQRAGEQMVVLEDRTAGSEATFVPGLGFACVSFRVGTLTGAWSVLAEPPDDAALRQQATRYGIPILFPWPNRIRDGLFSFGGQQYQLARPPGQAHASHGYARLWPWTLEAAEAHDDRAFCRASVTIHGDASGGWPFPAQLLVEYSLTGSTLTLRAEATNVGDKPMPVGFGIHPWFPVPLGQDGDRDRCELRLPANAFWVLDELITTGERRPVDEAFDARQWRALADTYLDDVYTDLTLDDGWFAADVRDPASGRQVTVRSESVFREHVVYAPANRSVICLEPYTCPTDAFNLQSQGIDAGVVILDPGERWSGRVEIIATA